MSKPKIFFETLLFLLILWDVLTTSVNTELALTIIVIISIMVTEMAFIAYAVQKSAYNAKARLVPIMINFFFLKPTIRKKSLQ